MSKGPITKLLAPIAALAAGVAICVGCGLLAAHLRRLSHEALTRAPGAGDMYYVLDRIPNLAVVGAGSAALCIVAVVIGLRFVGDDYDRLHLLYGVAALAILCAVLILTFAACGVVVVQSPPHEI
jgi:hypothetical protein